MDIAMDMAINLSHFCGRTLPAPLVEPIARPGRRAQLAAPQARERLGPAGARRATQHVPGRLAAAALDHGRSNRSHSSSSS